jgi:hypothetical protein
MASTCDAIAPAIREVVALGLVVVTEQGCVGNSEFRKASKYRLTYIHTKAANPAAVLSWLSPRIGFFVGTLG